MSDYTRLETAAREFCAAAALAVNDAHWENYGEDGTPDYPHSRTELDDDWIPTHDYVVDLLKRVRSATEAHLKLLSQAKDEEISAPMELNPPDPRGLNPPNTTRYGPLPKDQALKAIKSLEFLEKLGAQIRWETSKAPDGTELWTIYVAPLEEEELTPEQRANRKACGGVDEEPDTPAAPRREDRFKSKAGK